MHTKVSRVGTAYSNAIPKRNLFCDITLALSAAHALYQSARKSRKPQPELDSGSATRAG